MRSYRVYRMNGAGGVETAEWLEAESDSAALEQAKRLNGRFAREVWDRGRLVGRVGLED